MLAFMWIRIYNLVRTILNGTVYMDAYSKKICNQYGFNPGVKFILKSLLKSNPEKTVSLIFFGTVFIAAYLIRIVELPYYHQQGESFDMFDSIWLTVITLTTVGYGDIYAQTVAGRIFTMMLALWGATLISLLVVIFSGIFELDKK